MTGNSRNLIRMITLTALMLMSVLPFRQVSAVLIPVTASTTTNGFAEGIDPKAADFIASLDTDEEVIKGIYLEDGFALRVVQQPAGKPGFVSSVNGVVTQFGPAQEYGVIGLLAHNFLSGSEFFDVKLGDMIIVANGNSVGRVFKVSSIRSFQALSPNSTSSRFIDQDTQVQYSASQLFSEMYSGDPHLVLQTCIAKDGEPSWGRLFITAIEVVE